MLALPRRATAAAPLLIAATALANSYTIVDLGTTALPVQVNKSGAVAGRGNGVDNEAAYLYRGNRWHVLASQLAIAGGINAGGDVVGTQENVPVLWPRGEKQRQVALPVKNVYGVGNGIARDDAVAGFFQNFADGGHYHCFMTDAQNNSVDLGYIARGDECFAFAINNRHQVVGWSLNGKNGTGKTRAFLWQDGTMRNLGVPDGAVESMAYSINERGHVVGGAYFADGSEHAFLWSDGAMKDIGANDRFTVTVAQSINDKGGIVGYANESNNDNHAVRFADGEVIDLASEVDGLGDWTSLEFAVSVNNDGIIVGYGVRQGAEHGFELVPQ